MNSPFKTHKHVLTRHAIALPNQEKSHHHRKIPNYTLHASYRYLLYPVDINPPNHFNHPLPKAIQNDKPPPPHLPRNTPPTPRQRKAPHPYSYTPHTRPGGELPKPVPTSVPVHPHQQAGPACVRARLAPRGARRRQSTFFAAEGYHRVYGDF